MRKKYVCSLSPRKKGVENDPSLKPNLGPAKNSTVIFESGNNDKKVSMTLHLQVFLQKEYD